MAELRRDTRCQVCTGCGRCFGDNRIVYVLPAGSQFALRSPIHHPLVAVDLGTTTIAMSLLGPGGEILDTWTAVNPQRPFGADVISRIQRATDRSVALELKNLVERTLQEGFERFRKTLREETEAESGGLRLQQGILAGNTTMIYLLCGLETEELGHAPFSATHLQSRHLLLDGVDLKIFPGFSAFVGGDITAGCSAVGLGKKKGWQLLIDLGTNGELVLGCENGIVATATAAGPAFEGGANAGIWGADMVHLVAELKRQGLVDSQGLLAEAYFSEGIRIGDVLITQAGIRALQLAKAAIRTGIEILLRQMRLTTADIDTVYLAGGFGFFLQPRDAEEIELLPVGLVEKCESCGNSALLGAQMWGEEELPATAMEVLGMREEALRVVNLAECEDFQDLYLQSMNLEK